MKIGNLDQNRYFYPLKQMHLILRVTMRKDTPCDVSEHYPGSSSSSSSSKVRRRW